MRLDVSVFRYMTKDDFRVLTSLEMGHKNHQLVPVVLIERIARLRGASCRQVLSNLLKHKLIAHDGQRYDGYKLTYNGYDFLALRTFMARGHIQDVGIRMGVGKEADIHVAWGPPSDPDDPHSPRKKYALKLHRLGRVSFRTIKRNRDYLQHRKNASWMYLSRLAATKEYAYNKALWEAGFRVPVAVDHNRHCILMEFIEAYPLYQMKRLRKPERVLSGLFALLTRLARAGLIHGDFNEFNLMIDLDEKVTLIDFPQVVTTSHPNADFYFDRDVDCVRTFFKKRFGLAPEEGEYPTWEQLDAIYGLVDREEAEFTTDNRKKMRRQGGGGRDGAGAKQVTPIVVDSSLMQMSAGEDELLLGYCAMEKDLEVIEEGEECEEGAGEGAEDSETERLALERAFAEDAVFREYDELEQPLEDAELSDAELEKVFKAVGLNGKAEDEDLTAEKASKANRSLWQPSSKTALREEACFASSNTALREEHCPSTPERATSSRENLPENTPLTDDARHGAGRHDDRNGDHDEDTDSDSSDEEAGDADGKRSARRDDLPSPNADDTVTKVADQIHVLQKKKRKKLTVAEIQERLKKNGQGGGGMKGKNLNKVKSRKGKNDAAKDCRDAMGGVW